MGIAWVLLANFVFPAAAPDTTKQIFQDGVRLGEGGKRVKEEEMSDTERTFPTMGRQPPLKYESSSGHVKSEGEGVLMAEIPLPPGVEADDEDDETDGDGGWRDSGIGTSYSDAGAARSGVRKRRR